MKKIILLLHVLLLVCFITKAQTSYPVTDTQPLLLNGLTMGYNIKSTEVKAVGDKGNFSRYSVKFYVTNTSAEAKIILYKQGLNLLGNVSDQLVQFNCLNATGARFTSKQATISAPACNVLALTDDKDCSTNKTSQIKRFVQIGYWIQAGQTISADAILICPLNEQPKVEAVYLVNLLQPSASAAVGGDGGIYQNNPPPPPPPGIDLGIGQDFIKIRNVFSNTYLNCQTNLGSTAIDAGWWSAQWVLVKVPGCRCYYIKNRWKGTYLTTDTGAPGLFVNYMSEGARWILEPTQDPNSFRLMNMGSHQYLCIGSNDLKMTTNAYDTSTAWAFEQP